ncbi:MAG: beta-galactosidase trimerization domain-containing protein, partial [Acidobacteria bacterium]|nr:beta-galactosidase trimerization domain-containing protein [Acidobacteriota bacterium]
ADYLDWRTFLTEKLAEDLKARNSAVKEIVPRAVTSSHAAIPSVFTNPANGDGTPDDWMMSESVDYWGTSFYPKHSIPSTHWSLARRALVMDFIRSSAGEKGFYNGELQGGYGVRGVVVGQEIVADETELYTWGMVSRGAKAINFYAFYPMSTGYEAGGYGLINLDGTLTERSKRAGVIATIISANAVRLLESKPAAAEAAVIVNRMATLVGGAQNTSDRLAIRDSVAGYHRMFFERNIPLDFLSAQRLTQVQLRKYKLVIVPYPIQMSTQMAGQLEAYVREGGHLFMEARPGWNDESGRAQNLIPGFGWETMLGVREKSVSPRTDPRVKWGAAEFGGSAMEERFDVLDSAAKVVATFDDGSPAAFQKSFGKGSAIVLGTFAGILAETKPVDMHPLGEILVAWAGLNLPSLKFTSPIELKEMESNAGKFVFLFNHGKSPAHVEVSIRLKKLPVRIENIMTGITVPITGEGGGLSLEMPPLSARVFRFDY